MRRVSKSERARLGLTLNGRKVSGEAEPRMLLSDFLRHVLGATGTHVGCEHGVCGCCTVLLDGAAVRSCLTLAIQAEGRTLTTVEIARRCERKAQCAAAGLPEQSCAAVRVLHPRHPHVVHRFSGAQPRPVGGRGGRRAQRPSVPLHRLCRDRIGRARSSGPPPPTQQGAEMNKPQSKQVAKAPAKQA